jgi:Protein of unknown function (DUF1194)
MSAVPATEAMMGSLRRSAGLLTIVIALLVLAPARAAEKVDLLLVLASDVSRSVDADKFELQRRGYGHALSDPRVIEAIRSGTNGRIGVCFMEWSGVMSQKLVIDWTAIGSADTARQFGDRILEAPRSFTDRTSISAAIDFAMAQLERAPFESPRRTIDVSGDGTNNSGRDVTTARDEAVAKGVTINGLVILSERPLAWNPEHTNPPGGLENYYRQNVVGGPRAFVIAAQDFNAFGQALINKLIAEVAAAGTRRIANRE